jgi:hypothetical protein
MGNYGSENNGFQREVQRLIDEALEQPRQMPIVLRESEFAPERLLELDLN